MPSNLLFLPTRKPEEPKLIIFHVKDNVKGRGQGKARLLRRMPNFPLIWGQDDPGSILIEVCVDMIARIFSKDISLQVETSARQAV
jgi:hypothetical protein